MSAISAPKAEPAQLEDDSHDAPATRFSSPSSPLSDISSPPEHAYDFNPALHISQHAVIKDEQGLEDGESTWHVPATPSKHTRVDSEASLNGIHVTERKNNKRKRVVSPPWQFPTVEQSTIKAADGRRISARFNSTTSGQSESEGHVSKEPHVTRTPQRRAGSPPWKKFAAEGPSSINVDGKRKSGRVHRDSMSQEQPHQVKSHSKSKAVVANGTTPKVGRPRGRPPKHPRTEDARNATESAQKIVALQAKIKALKPSQVHQSDVDDHDDDDVGDEDDSIVLQRPATPRGEKTGKRKTLRGRASLPAPTHSSPKLKLRLTSARHQIFPTHPQSIPPPLPRPPQLSLDQLIKQYELQELQQPHMENERGPPGEQFFIQRNERNAVEEALSRQALVEAAKPGGALHKDTAKFYYDEFQPEPPQQYGHNDHLVYHALYLRLLQQREKTHHRALAKKVAQEALEFWKAKRGPTEEDIRAEQDKIFRLVHKQVVNDMRAKWDMVYAHVQQLKKERWEATEDAKRQERLQKQLEWSEKQIAKQRGELSDSDLDEDSTGDARQSDSENQSDSSEESEEENMSESQSEAEEAEEETNGELAGDELAAYLEFRRANAAANDDDEDSGEIESGVSSPQTGNEIRNGNRDADLSVLLTDGDLERHSESPGEEYAAGQMDTAIDDEDDDMKDEDREQDSAPSTRRSLPNIDPHGNDIIDANLSSDESISMYDSDEDMSSSDPDDDHDDASQEEASVDDDADEHAHPADNPLLGFLFSSKELRGIGLPTPTASAGGEEHETPREDTLGSHLEQHNVDDRAVEMEPVLNGETQEEDNKEEPSRLTGEANGRTEQAETGLDDGDQQDVAMDGDSPASAKSLVPIPSLMRGTLRSYQHAGLDWLASLYRNATNGILADEMGLGKTIQTISLLAHLAEHYGVWETHLVIVPTSVILNWVTEFQKFLPGFRVLGYYGTTEERAFKRKCWANDPHHEDKSKRGYNVVITSYNVAMQDINAIRVQQWHYLVLDEAHNIRNFNSQRWQVLIRLRTRARLLLTGTPLQNSLVELWSLLTFLTAGDDDPAHGDLEDFLSHWKDPVKEIFERGVSALSAEAQRVVDQLHISLRPFLLRRLKSEVEKDLPKKTESVVVCKLSKRQRQLYQEYMGLAATRESLARGNAVSAGRVLLSLRRVCNHPDLFDPRPIQTSLAMEASALDAFDPTASLVRKLLGVREELPDGLLIAGLEGRRKYILKRSRQLSGVRALRKQMDEIDKTPAPKADPSTFAGCRALQKLHRRKTQLEKLRCGIRATEHALADTPIYGIDLRELLTVHKRRPYSIVRPAKPVPQRFWRGNLPLSLRPTQADHLSDWLVAHDTALQRDVLTLTTYAAYLHDTIVRFAFCTPTVTAPVLDYTIPRRVQEAIRADGAYPAETDFGHEARSRTSIVFPDKRLLVYDSGKLQKLTVLLRELQARRSRSLIFTQMTGTLNILEQFLSLMSLPYLRLDGSTPVERRQLYAAEFNRPDSKYQCMILSSRAGGVGLNLTGASSVIFYDLDWNPQMDRQCMDRAHRIGQVRDVEVYKMVSEKTVEENILRRANQKSLLDQTVIQEGHFTTEYQQPSRPTDTDADDGDEDVAAAIERFLGGGEKVSTQTIESVEDREDVQAAQQARKEEHQDDADFADRSSKGPSMAPTPGPGGPDFDEEERQGHVDLYMTRLLEWALEGVPYVPPVVRRLDKHGRDPSHRPKRRR